MGCMHVNAVCKQQQSYDSSNRALPMPNTLRKCMSSLAHCSSKCRSNNIIQVPSMAMSMAKTASELPICVVEPTQGVGGEHTPRAHSCRAGNDGAANRSHEERLYACNGYSGFLCGAHRKRLSVSMKSRSEIAANRSHGRAAICLLYVQRLSVWCPQEATICHEKPLCASTCRERRCVSTCASCGVWHPASMALGRRQGCACVLHSLYIAPQRLEACHTDVLTLMESYTCM